jgi:transposase
MSHCTANKNVPKYSIIISPINLCEVVLMRKVDLNMKANEKYEIIKKLVDTNGNKKRAAMRLGYTMRHVNRMIKGYKEEGKSFFIHGNSGRKPAHTVDNETRQLVIDLYRTKYYDANYTHYTELLSVHEDIHISENCVRSILMDEFILSPKARRRTKKKVKKHLERLQKSAVTPKKAVEILDAIVAIEDAHPRRPRCAYAGEMLQMDASVHLWFGSEKTHLHIAVDDATGTITGAYFDSQETLNGYYNVLDQVLIQYGIPYKLLTDRRTVFEYKKKKTSSAEDDTFTQFSYACNQLGIEIETSSVAQAKGRVERMFQTLQSRLPVELRLAGVTTLEQANEFLNSYIKKFNAKFALPINSIKSVFEIQPNNEKINLTLAVLTSRKVDNGHCIRFDKNYYKPIDSNGYPVYYRKGTSGMVIKAFDGNLFFCVDDKVYSLDAVPDHQRISKNFDISTKQEKPRKRYIPPMSHPWKQASFERYLKKQEHRQSKVS